MKPLLRFRVRFDARNWARICVWKTRHQMLHQLGRTGEKTEACCRSGQFFALHKQTWKPVRGLLCELHFYPGSIRMGVITHECAHAAISYARRQKLDPLKLHPGKREGPDNERFCRVMGDIARQVVIGAARFIKRAGPKSRGRRL